MKMINLDAIMTQTIDFTLDGELIKVQQPGVKLIAKINKFQYESNNPDVDAVFAMQTEIVTAILNNNSSARKFTTKQVEALPQKVQNVILMAVIDDVSATDKDPN